MKSVIAIKRKMKTGIATVAICLMAAGSGSLYAQEISADHIKSARAAMAATGATDRLDGILPEVATFVKAGLIANRPDIESEINDIVNQVAISLAPRRGPLENEVATIYGNRFTKEELDSIQAFFSSETGIKFLTQTPTLFREVDEVSRVWREGIVRDMGAQVQEKLKEAGLQ